MPFRQGQHRVHHLAHGHRFQRQAVVGAVGRACAKEQAQSSRGFLSPCPPSSAGCGWWPSARSRSRRQALDHVHVGLVHQLRELPRVGRTGFPRGAGLRREGVKGQAGFPRSRQAVSTTRAFLGGQVDRSSGCACARPRMLLQRARARAVACSSRIRRSAISSIVIGGADGAGSRRRGTDGMAFASGDEGGGISRERRQTSAAWSGIPGQPAMIARAVTRASAGWPARSAAGLDGRLRHVSTVMSLPPLVWKTSQPAPPAACPCRWPAWRPARRLEGAADHMHGLAAAFRARPGRSAEIW